MRVDVTPRQFSARPGRPFSVTVRVTNTASIISGHELRVLGLDPDWVRVDRDQLSLFPDSSGVFVVTLRLPEGLPAGVRTVEVEVRELTAPGDVALVPLELTVPSDPNLSVALDQASITGGKRAAVGVLLENAGNAPLEVHLEGRDEETEVAFSFQPASPTLAPGEQLMGTAELRAKRPFLGSPRIRPFTVRAGSADAPAVTSGVFVQRPRFTRGNLALFGLLAAATVFAVVLSAALSQVVGQSNANRDLALQVAEASQSHPTGGSASVTGTVTQLGSGAPVSGVTVDLYKSSSPASPVVSTSTSPTGGYHFSGLAAGSYKLSFDGAGFTELWYPDSLKAKAAGVVTLKTKTHLGHVDIHLGGAPASISGTVTGGGTSGATLTLELPGPGATSAAGTSGSSSSPPPAGSGTGSLPTIVTTETLGSTGTFHLAKVPSPALYELVVNDPGYAPASQEIDLGGGQNRKGVTIELHKGDGAVAGTVFSPKGPLGGATISASSGTTTVDTVTATTKKQVGTFSLASLPTPSTLTLVVSAPGYASATLSVSLAPAQQVKGIAITLQPGEGSIAGRVKTPASSPRGGVTVTASNGTQTFTTTTLSTGKVGTYALGGLPVPGTYTVTFSRPDLASQTQAVSLPATGDTSLKGVDVSMVADTASLSGVVSGPGGPGVGEVTVNLASGTNTYQVLTAAKPTAGAYAVDGIAPGTYNLSFTRKGGAPTSVIVHLAAGQHLVQNETLSAAASIDGYVVAKGTGDSLPGAQVTLYVATQYPTVTTATTATNGSGAFTFSNVAAPQSFVVAVSYPKGSSPQDTVLLTTSLGAATPVCGSEATGQPSTSTSPPTQPSSTSTSTSTSTTTTSTTTTTPSTLTGTATTVTPVVANALELPRAAPSASCNPKSDPLKVRLP